VGRSHSSKSGVGGVIKNGHCHEDDGKRVLFRPSNAKGIHKTAVTVVKLPEAEKEERESPGADGLSPAHSMAEDGHSRHDEEGRRFHDEPGPAGIEHKAPALPAVAAVRG